MEENFQAGAEINIKNIITVARSKEIKGCVNNGARWIFTSYNFVFRYLAWFYLVVFYLINQMLELLMISYLLMKNKNE